MPKVSVIMGIYNCEETLDEAIDSLLGQTYSDWELIMCDDGSVDSTREIAQSYSRRYPERVRLIVNGQNEGLNKTLNHCFAEAKGKYIARMDGDDLSLPMRFEKEVNFLDAHPEYAIVSTQMVCFDEQGDFGLLDVQGEPRLDRFAKSPQHCHAACMVRREAFEAVGGYAERDDRLRVEDWDLWVRMYALGYRGYNIPEPLYKMRDDRNAISRRKFKYRLNEARVSVSAVKELHLPRRCLIYSIRPIVTGLLPASVYRALHRFRVKS